MPIVNAASPNQERQPTPAGAMGSMTRRTRALPPGVGGAPGGGTSSFRRNMPQGGVGGIAGPTVSGPKPASSVGATGTLGTATVPVPSGAIPPKGGGVFMENGGTNPGTGTMPVGRPTVPSPGGYGGFNANQIVQQNGQWGAVGRGGQFQPLGADALASWLQTQRRATPSPTPSQPSPATPPSGPPMAQGYVTPEQWAEWTRTGLNDWFVNSQPQGANDWNAFNNWFRQFGRYADPAAWDRLYGDPGTVFTG